MRSELGDNVRLKHVLDAIEEIEKYLLAEIHPQSIIRKNSKYL